MTVTKLDPTQGLTALGALAAAGAFLRKQLGFQRLTIGVVDSKKDALIVGLRDELAATRAELVAVKATLGAELTVLRADLARATVDLEWTRKELVRLQDQLRKAPS